MTDATPPRLARALLERVLAADVRDDILANLDDLHAHHLARSGPRFAAFWYWRDAIGLAIGFGRPALGRFRWIAALRAAPGAISSAHPGERVPRPR
ncbi:MAG: permease prefix domain 2-containing transporter [Gemmatimonadales bacterium]